MGTGYFTMSKWADNQMILLIIRVISKIITLVTRAIGTLQ